jgi:predicted metal-dependent phosphoesterase TrpH
MDACLVARDEWRTAPGATLEGPTFQPPAARMVGRADLHVHSVWSDGMQSPEAIVRAAAGRVDVLALTDHDTIEGAWIAQAYARAHPELGVDVIVGEEVSTLNGHVLALFIQERIPPRLSAERSLELIHAQDGLAVAAHPFHPSGPGPPAIRPWRRSSRTFRWTASRS